MLAKELPSAHVFQDALQFAQQHIGSSETNNRRAACTVLLVVAEGCSKLMRKSLQPVLKVMVQRWFLAAIEFWTEHRTGSGKTNSKVCAQCRLLLLVYKILKLKCAQLLHLLWPSLLSTACQRSCNRLVKYCLPYLQCLQITTLPSMSKHATHCKPSARIWVGMSDQQSWTSCHWHSTCCALAAYLLSTTSAAVKCCCVQSGPGASLWTPFLRRERCG